MGANRTSHRNYRRGGALATAMIFMVLIAVAGTALLSISLINRTELVRQGIDVRVMIAAEAGIETLRGRFTLIQGVQDDWAWLNVSTWTSVGTPTVNGLPVTVEARLIGGPSVPTARIRAMATASGTTRVVEYLIKVATFSDYAVFTGNTANLGQNYKAVGNVYTEGDINIGSTSTGAQMLGEVTLTGTINKSNGELDSYTFPLSNPLQNQPAIPFPTWAAPWQALEDVARTSIGHIYAENTLAIVFKLNAAGTGTVYDRLFVERLNNGTGGGTVPTGLGWINLANGSTANFDNTGAGLRNNDYRARWETDIPVPDEGVIYVKTGQASQNGPGGANTLTKDIVGGNVRNNYVQTRASSNSGDNSYFYDNSFSRTTPVLMLCGQLYNARVSVACDHKIVINRPISYKTLLDNPGYRRFWADGINGKESAGAIGFKEMLGVMARGDIQSALPWWTSSMALQGSQIVTTVTGEYLPGHFSAASDGGQYTQDGVYMSMGDTRPHDYIDGQTYGEYWFNGGLIAQGNYGSGNANHFKRRNYDWDYRMRLTCPPYFLRAYNTSAVFIPGTWRTYTL